MDLYRAERTERAERAVLPPSPSFLLWIDSTPRPGWANMAIDEALLERAQRDGESWLRLYQWEPHCLSFGRHEPASRRYDVERIKDLGIDTVRRPTGGRAVWHGRELTYAVAAPSLRFGSLQAAYLEIHRMLGDALDSLGARTSLAPPARTPALEAGACFAQPAGGELMIAGRKVVGSAQYRQGAALLQHGSILLEDDQRIVMTLSRGGLALDSGSGLGPDLASPLSALLGRTLQAREVAEVIGRTAVHRWGGAWQRPPEPTQVLEAASRHYLRFRSTEWTWAR